MGCAIMKKSLLPLLSLCLLAAPVLYGCDNHKPKASSATSANASSSSDSRDTAVYYAPESIEQRFDVAGFKLGISQAEAEAKLSHDQWEGKFAAMPESGEETSVQGFQQPDKELALFRHATTSGVAKVHAIKFRQTYALDHDWKEVAAALIKKYGPPTSTNEMGGGRAALEWAPKKLTTNIYCDELHRCSDQEKANMETQALFPRLTVTIDKREVVIDLGSARMSSKDLEGVKAAAVAKEQQQLKNNSKAEKVQF